MTDHTIYCGNYRRVEDGQRLRGPLVRYEGKEMPDAAVEAASGVLKKYGAVSVVDVTGKAEN